MDENKLQSLIQSLEHEIHGLKNASNKSPEVKTFWKSYTTSGPNNITITYETGTQPIITNVYSWGNIILGPVSNNTQKLFYSGQADIDIWITSTRPILSITQ